MKTIRTSPVFFWLLIFGLVIGSLAQKPADNKAALANFARSIDNGKLPEVERDLFNFVVANPSEPQGFFLLSKLRFKQGRLTEAKSLANKALSLDPGFVQAKVILANISLRSGELMQVRTILDGISAKDIADNKVKFELAGLYKNIGDCQSAVNLINSLPVRIKNADALPLRAECSLRAGNRKEVDLMIPHARIQTRTNPSLAIEFAKVLLGAGLIREAAELGKLVVAANPKDFEALLLLSKADISRKDLASARTRLLLAERIRSNSDELFFTRSLIESEEGKYQAAYESLEKSLSLNSNNVGTLAQYVLVALRVSQGGRAVKAAEKLLTIQPENPEFLYLYGISTLQTNNLRDAEGALAKYAEARPSDSRGCLALGLVYAGQSSKTETARQQLRKCLEMDPRNFEAAYQLGLSFKTSGDPAKAAEYFEQTVKIFPDYSAALRELGTVYLQAGEEVKARPFLEKAIKLDPNDADAHFQLSRLYNILGERELGKKHLEIFQNLKTPKKEGM